MAFMFFDVCFAFFMKILMFLLQAKVWKLSAGLLHLCLQKIQTLAAVEIGYRYPAFIPIYYTLHGLCSLMYTLLGTQ